jgi:DNA-directed RNA polymerase specialized sigma24 family protein
MADTDRTERLLALILLAVHKPSSQQEKARLLSLAGFSNLEIADILETTTAVVAQNLYLARKKPARKPPAK